MLRVEIWPLLLAVAALGLVYWVLPTLTRPELFFSVTVPAAFRQSAEGRRILLGYRAALALVLAVAACLALLSGWKAWHGALAAAFLVLVGGSLAAFLRARAQTQPHGVEPATVREADMTPRPLSLPGGWVLQLAPFVALAAVLVYLHAHWGEIPARFASHWNFHGEANGWSKKSRLSVYGGPLMGMTMCAMLLFFQWAIGSASRRIAVSGAAAAAEQRFRRAVMSYTLAAEYLAALLTAWTGVLVPTAKPVYPALTIVLAVAAPMLLLLVLAMVLLRLGQGGTRVAAPTEAAGQRPIGDRTSDRYWKLGLLYVNRSDPAIFVEKRFGFGYTLNLGHPVAWLFAGVGVAAAILAIVFGHRHVR